MQSGGGITTSISTLVYEINLRDLVDLFSLNSNSSIDFLDLFKNSLSNWLSSISKISFWFVFSMSMKSTITKSETLISSETGSAAKQTRVII